MQIKAVLFDIDGTLVDSNEFHVQAWQEAFDAAGISLEASAIRAQIGKGTDQLVPALLPDASSDLIDRLGEAHGAIFSARYLERVKPFANAHELLLHVHEAGRKVVLASSASKKEVDYYATLLNIKDILDVTTSIDDVERSKPAPDIFATALKRLHGLRSDDVVAVGDAPYDAEAAAHCGIVTVSLRSGGFSDAALLEAGAIAIYDDATALLSDFDASPLAA